MCGNEISMYIFILPLPVKNLKFPLIPHSNITCPYQLPPLPPNKSESPPFPPLVTFPLSVQKCKGEGGDLNSSKEGGNYR